MDRRGRPFHSHHGSSQYHASIANPNPQARYSPQQMSPTGPAIIPGSSATSDRVPAGPYSNQQQQQHPLPKFHPRHQQQKHNKLQKQKQYHSNNNHTPPQPQQPSHHYTNTSHQRYSQPGPNKPNPGSFHLSSSSSASPSASPYAQQQPSLMQRAVSPPPQANGNISGGPQNAPSYWFRNGSSGSTASAGSNSSGGSTLNGASVPPTSPAGSRPFSSSSSSYNKHHYHYSNKHVYQHQYHHSQNRGGRGGRGGSGHYKSAPNLSRNYFQHKQEQPQQQQFFAVYDDQAPDDESLNVDYNRTIDEEVVHREPAKKDEEVKQEEETPQVKDEPADPEPIEQESPEPEQEQEPAIKQEEQEEEPVKAESPVLSHDSSPLSSLGPSPPDSPAHESVHKEDVKIQSPSPAEESDNGEKTTETDADADITKVEEEMSSPTSKSPSSPQPASRPQRQNTRNTSTKETVEDKRDHNTDDASPIDSDMEPEAQPQEEPLQHNHSDNEDEHMPCPATPEPPLPTNDPEDGIFLSPVSKMPKKLRRKKAKKEKQIHYQLFSDLPSKTEEARATFETLIESIYTKKGLGNSGQFEAMNCDCRQEWDGNKNQACGDDSDCINRLTSIECVNSKCFCGKDCQNQRFQKREYAKIDIIQTEKKGYGVRTLENVAQGSFVYEYVGEVISESGFRKRAEDYKTGGNRHFYFMMLQKGEFIDATSKGGLARFCNHSCNPNCYVDKWVVDDKLRMGIFSKRDILKGEEITFDYNVDRYGADAQPCYCGEPNCIGLLGGKTQTEAVNKLPQLVLEALDMDASDEDTYMSTKKGTKKKRKTEEERDHDFDVDDEDGEEASALPTKPVTVSSVSKIMSSLMQAREDWLVNKLLSRIARTDDTAIHFRVMQMHGYQIFNNLLRDWKATADLETRKDKYFRTRVILEIMSKWPRKTKNKISSSKIEATVEEISNECEDDEIKTLSSHLCKEWGSLQMAYRIPRREKKQDESPESDQQGDAGETEISASTSSTAAVAQDYSSSTPDSTAAAATAAASSTTATTTTGFGSKPAFISKQKVVNQDRFADLNLPEGPRKTLIAQQAALSDILPPGWRSAEAPNGYTYYYNRELNVTQWERPVPIVTKGGNAINPLNGNFYRIPPTGPAATVASTTSSTPTPTGPSTTNSAPRREYEYGDSPAYTDGPQGRTASVASGSNSTPTGLNSVPIRRESEVSSVTPDSRNGSWSASSAITPSATPSAATAAANGSAKGDPRSLKKTSEEQTLQKIIEEACQKQAENSSSNGSGGSGAISRSSSNGEEGFSRSNSTTLAAAAVATAQGTLQQRTSSLELWLDDYDDEGTSQPVSPGSETLTEMQSRLLQKSFAKIVPNIVVRYDQLIGVDNVKQYSRDIVHLLVQKELRLRPAKIETEFQQEKKLKIKAFVKTYMNKVIERLKKKKQLEPKDQAQMQGPGGSKLTNASASSANSTPTDYSSFTRTGTPTLGGPSRQLPAGTTLQPSASSSSSSLNIDSKSRNDGDGSAAAEAAGWESDDDDRLQKQLEKIKRQEDARNAAATQAKSDGQLEGSIEEVRRKAKARARAEAWMEELQAEQAVGTGSSNSKKHSMELDNVPLAKRLKKDSSASTPNDLSPAVTDSPAAYAATAAPTLASSKSRSRHKNSRQFQFLQHQQQNSSSGKIMVVEPPRYGDDYADDDAEMPTDRAAQLEPYNTEDDDDEGGASSGSDSGSESNEQEDPAANGRSSYKRNGFARHGGGHRENSFRHHSNNHHHHHHSSSGGSHRGSDSGPTIFSRPKRGRGRGSKKTSSSFYSRHGGGSRSSSASNGNSSNYHGFKKRFY